MRWISNPLRRTGAGPVARDDVLAFHRSLPGYAPTALLDAPALAAAWGVGRVRLKVEAERFGLPAFKVLGVSWAARRLLGEPPYDPDLELVCATDGNHGRAVARVARLGGIRATVLVPAGTAPSRIDAIAGEGARVEVVDGTYDDAVRRSAAMAGPRRLVLSDTSWPGYEEVPRWVIEGYATIFAEVDEPVDVAVVPIGVGALAAAAAQALAGRARLAGVEPSVAACVLESARAGRLTEVPGPHGSIMAGLNAGLPSEVAWPDVSGGFDVLCAVEDAVAVDGMRALADLGVAAGECAGGAVGAAALLLADDGARRALQADERSAVLVLLTEGVTDPDAYARLVGPRLRAARPGEAAAITALIRRSKAHWGYDAAFLDAASAELTVTEEHLAAADVLVAERPDGTLAGVATVDGTALEHLFADPAEIGTGLGRRLLAAARARAAARGIAELTVVSDPNAEPFYRSQGAVRAGTERSPSTGRELPLLVIPTAGRPGGPPGPTPGGRTPR